jgi:hypothetical protein
MKQFWTRPRARIYFMTDIKLELFLQKKGEDNLLFGPDLPNQEASKKFEEIIAHTIREVDEDSTIILIRSEIKTLSAQVEALKEKLKIRIEAPLRI